jgi:hypothetical protein
MEAAEVAAGSEEKGEAVGGVKLNRAARRLLAQQAKKGGAGGAEVVGEGKKVGAVEVEGKKGEKVEKGQKGEKGEKAEGRDKEGKKGRMGKGKKDKKGEKVDAKVGKEQVTQSEGGTPAKKRKVKAPKSGEQAESDL